MLRADNGVDATTHTPSCFHQHPARRATSHQVIQDDVGDVLVEDALCAKGLKIELEALQLDAGLVRNAPNDNRREVRLACLWADTGKFVNMMLDQVGLVDVRVGECLY